MNNDYIAVEVDSKFAFVGLHWDVVQVQSSDGQPKSVGLFYTHENAMLFVKLLQDAHLAAIAETMMNGG